MIHPIFTIAGSLVQPGVRIERFELRFGSKPIPAVVAGLRQLTYHPGVVRVDLPDPLYELWRADRVVGIKGAELGKTDSGENKFIPGEPDPASDQAIIVVRTRYPSGNDYTGDCLGWRCASRECAQLPPLGGPYDLFTQCLRCGRKSGDSMGGPQRFFAPFPGQMIARGTSTSEVDQVVALVPKQTVFRTICGGPEYYYLWNGTTFQPMNSREWFSRARTAPT